MPGIGSKACQKIKPGALSLREERLQKQARRRQGKKGPTAQRRASKARKVLQAERAVKAEAKRLDGNRCRWPGCEVPPSSWWGQIDAAHVEAEGMGGDPTLERCTVENLWAICRWHHRGPRSLHSGHLRVEKLTPHGTRGPMGCYERDGAWELFTVSVPPEHLGMIDEQQPDDEDE